jgi:hypothetical protein
MIPSLIWNRMKIPEMGKMLLTTTHTLLFGTDYKMQLEMGSDDLKPHLLPLSFHFKLIITPPSNGKN